MSITEFQARLQAHAQTSPPRVAIRTADAAITYGELLAEIRAQQAQLQTQQQNIYVLEDTDPVAWIVKDLALLFTGGACVPMPPFFSPRQRQFVLQQLEGEVRLPPLTAKVTFTSGTTGEPKGVCLSADNILRTLQALLQRLSDVSVQRHLSLMPLAVLLENIAGVYLALWLGAEVVLLTPEQTGLQGSSSLTAATFFSALKRYQPDSLILTPALLQAVVTGVEQNYLSAAQFSLLAVGGARLCDTLERRALALGLPLLQGYGLSEFSSVVTLNVPGKCVPGSVGSPLNHAQIHIDDGEIVVAGNTMLGYLDSPESWFPQRIRTGDLGHFDEAGNLFIRGRRKHIIVTPFGRNVDPEWLETELCTSTAVRQAAVFGSESLPLTALIVASTQSNEELISQALLALNQQLPDYARIQRFFVLDSPFSVSNQQLTGTGRLRRAAIAEAYQSLLTSRQ